MAMKWKLRSFFASLACLVFITPGIDCKQCPTNWKKLFGKCFYFGQNSLSYDSANEECLNIGGRLFEPKNDLANGYIASVSKNFLKTSEPAYWIGITDLQMEGKFVYASSGSQLYYQNWAFNDSEVDEPDNNMDMEDCAAVNDAVGHWLDEDCNNIKQYVCEDLKDDVDYWRGCLPGWNLINKKCYKLIDQTVQFAAAHDLCKVMGGKLFEPTYRNVEIMVTEFYLATYQTDTFWLGITDKIDEGRYKYASTYKDIDYTNWAKTSFTDEADNKDNQDCVVLSGGVWRDKDCDCGNIAKPLCEQMSLEGCSDEPGWVTIKGRCFYFGESASYSDAQDDCLDKGGRLFEPRNAEANKVVYLYVRNNLKIPYWIGINANNDADKYVYASSQGDLVYAQWDDDEPDKENYYARCVLVQDHNANWADLHCEASRNYVCEIPVFFQPFWDKIAVESDKKDVIDYILENIFETESCTSSSTDDTTDGSGKPLARFLSFGGLPLNNKIYRIDPNTGESCLHSELPTTALRIHVYEFMDSLLACSSALSLTSKDQKNLHCWKWSEELGWEVYSTPAANGIGSFIDTAKIPGVGIWFIDNIPGPPASTKPPKTQMLSEIDETWSSGPHWTTSRNKACAVRISPTKVARIGGFSPGTGEGNTIDVYDFKTGTESLNVTQLHYVRKHHSCALISKGKDGHPTVAILGNEAVNNKPETFTYEMALWDTVTNEVTLVDHPPGYEDQNFFRPTMFSCGDSSILLVNSETEIANGTEYSLSGIFQYLYGYGWISLGSAPAPLEQFQQNGIYLLDNPDLGEYNSLDRCMN